MAREDEYCLEGRRYALYAEIVGPTDIGRHRPRKRCGGRPRRAHCFPRCVAVPPSPWWTLVVDALRGRMSVEPLKTETSWLGAASSRKILVQVQRGFAGLGPRRLANSIFHIIECRQCQASADCKSSAFESTLGEHRSMSPCTMWRGQASTQGRFTTAACNDKHESQDRNRDQASRTK